MHVALFYTQSFFWRPGVGFVKDVDFFFVLFSTLLLSLITVRMFNHVNLRELFIGKTFGERSFSFCAAKQWNSLPLHIRSIQTTKYFKAALKTHLFNIYFQN